MADPRSDEVSRFQNARDQPVSPHPLRSLYTHHFTRLLCCQALDLLPLPLGNSRSSAASLIHGLSRIFRSPLAGSRYPATPQSRPSSPLPIRQRAGVLFEIAIRSLCQGPRQPRTDPAGGATAALRQRNPANARSAFVRTAGGANGANAPPDRGFLLGGLSNASTF